MPVVTRNGIPFARKAACTPYIARGACAIQRQIGWPTVERARRRRDMEVDVGTSEIWQSEAACLLSQGERSLRRSQPGGLRFREALEHEAVTPGSSAGGIRLSAIRHHVEDNLGYASSRRGDRRLASKLSSCKYSRV